MNEGKQTRQGLTLLTGIAAILLSAGAGIYLLSSGSASAETTVFDAIMHGIGIYFLARAAWMLHELGK